MTERNLWKQHFCLHSWKEIEKIRFLQICNRAQAIMTESSTGFRYYECKKCGKLIFRDEKEIIQIDI